jgi:hypothetical protein
LAKKTVIERVEEFKRKHPKKVNCGSKELLEVIDSKAGYPWDYAWRGFQFGYMRGYNAAQRERSKT